MTAGIEASVPLCFFRGVEWSAIVGNAELLSAVFVGFPVSEPLVERKFDLGLVLIKNARMIVLR